MVVPRKGVTHLGRSTLPVVRKEVFKDLNLLDFVMPVPRKGRHLGRSTLPVFQFDKHAKTTRKCLTSCSPLRPDIAEACQTLAGSRLLMINHGKEKNNS